MFLCNMRWVEVDSDGNDGDDDDSELLDTTIRASPIIEHLVLFYDAIVEIALMYLPFLLIPNSLGLIKTNANTTDEDKDSDHLSNTDIQAPLLHKV